MIGECQLLHLICIYVVDIFINDKKHIFKTSLINVANISVF